MAARRFGNGPPRAAAPTPSVSLRLTATSKREPFPSGDERLRKRANLYMEVDLIFKIAAIGILVAVLNQVLSRAGRDEQAMMTTLAGLVVVLMMVVQEIASLFDLVKDLFGL